MILWSIMKELIGTLPQRRSAFRHKVFLDNKTITDISNIAEKLNTFFTGMALSSADKIAIPFETLLKKANNSLLDRHLSINELNEAFFSLKKIQRLMKSGSM